MLVERRVCREAARLQVETIAWAVVLKIWGETEEANKAQEKHQMEIGKILRRRVKPFNRRIYILKEQSARILHLYRRLKKLREKQRHGAFARVVGD